MGRTAPAVLLAALLLACKEPSPAAGDLPAPSSSAAPSVPADHLAPDELVEGKEQAFGVVLPRGLVVEKRRIEIVTASGPMTVRSLVNYFRPRLTGGGLREGERSATFEHVTTAATPPDTYLTIHIAVLLGKTQVDVSSTPIVAAPILPDEESRWRQVGLTTDGKLLDPTHLQ